jgi:hypothetical protein
MFQRFLSCLQGKRIEKIRFLTYIKTDEISTIEVYNLD